MEINNREIATLVWLAIIIAALLIHAPLRSPLWAVLKALFQRVFIIVFTLAGLYVALCVTLLEWLGIWDWANLKTTIVWTLTFAFVTIFDANRIDEERTYFRKTIRDTISVTALLIFIMELQSFPLAVELIMLPIMTFLALMHSFSESKPEHAIVTRFLGWVIAIVALGYLSYSVSETIQAWPTLDTIGTIHELVVPILLSLMFLPFLYALSVFLVYDRVFAGLNWGIKNDDLRRFAKRKAVLSFGANLSLLKRWRRMVMNDRPDSRDKVRRSAAETKRLYRREENPPMIKPEDGWSPYAAMRFLDEFGIQMEDYHQLSDQWRASSKIHKLDDKVLSNHVVFYVEGDELHANELTLELDVNHPERGEEADAKFTAMIAVLLRSAIGEERTKEFAERAVGENPTVTVDGFRIRLERKEWSMPTLSGYERALIIGHPKKPKAAEGGRSNENRPDDPSF